MEKVRTFSFIITLRFVRFSLRLVLMNVVLHSVWILILFFSFTKCISAILTKTVMQLVYIILVAKRKIVGLTAFKKPQSRL